MDVDPELFLGDVCLYADDPAVTESPLCAEVGG